jgi:hypothetical protein
MTRPLPSRLHANGAHLLAGMLRTPAERKEMRHVEYGPEITGLTSDKGVKAKTYF